MKFKKSYYRHMRKLYNRVRSVGRSKLPLWVSDKRRRFFRKR